MWLKRSMIRGLIVLPMGTYTNSLSQRRSWGMFFDVCNQLTKISLTAASRHLTYMYVFWALWIPVISCCERYKLACWMHYRRQCVIPVCCSFPVWKRRQSCVMYANNISENILMSVDEMYLDRMYHFIWFNLYRIKWWSEHFTDIGYEEGNIYEYTLFCGHA